MEKDKKLLHRAIKIAGDNIRAGGGPFGAIITKKGKIISEAFNRVTLDNDPTAHAEILAIRQAASYLNSYDLSECTLYSSCEPCPMCLGAVYWSGIKTVVYATNRYDAEDAGFSDKMIYDEIMLEPGKRRIRFVHYEDTESREVFIRWQEMGNKKLY